MISIDGYNIVEQLRETANIAVFEVESSIDNKSCVLRLSLSKTFNNNLKRAHQIQKDLSAKFPKMWLAPITSGIDAEGRFYSITPKPEMTLDTLLKAGTKLSRKDIIFVLKSITASLLPLENYKISHGELCAENIYFLADKGSPLKLNSYSIKLSEISPELINNVSEDIQTIVKISFALAARKRSLWAVPNSTVKNFDSIGKVFNKKRFSTFFNNYICTETTDHEILKKLIKDISKLNAQVSIPIFCVFTILTILIGCFYASEFLVSKDRDFQKESIAITADELESLWRNYCLEYTLWLEALSEYKEKDLGDFNEYYKTKIIPLIATSDFSISDYDPRSSKLADLDIDVYSDISELSKKCPNQILSNNDKKANLLKLFANIEKAKDAISQWESISKLDSFYKIFKEHNIELKWLNSLKSNLFTKEIGTNLEKIGKVAKVHNEYLAKYMETLSLATKLSAIGDLYITSLGVNSLNKNISLTENLEQLEGVLDTELSRLRDLNKFCENKYNSNVIDITLLKKELSQDFELGNWDKVENWKLYVLEYSKIKSNEFPKEKQDWNERINKLEKGISQIGKSDLKDIPDLSSSHKALLKNIARYSEIPRVEKYRNELSNALDIAEKSLSEFESTCGNYMLSRKNNLKDAIKLWTANLKERKWSNAHLSSIWKVKVASITNNFEENLYLSNVEKFIADRDKISNFAKRLEEIEEYKIVEKKIKLPSNLSKVMSIELERIFNIEYEKSMNSVFTAVKNISIDKISIREIEKLSLFPEIKSSLEQKISDIQEFGNLIATLDSFSDTPNFETKTYEESLKKLQRNKTFENLAPELSAQYKNTLAFVEKISNISNLKDLLKESNNAEISTICALLAWNKIFYTLKQNPKALSFKIVLEESDKFASKLFSSKKEAFFTKLKEILIASLAVANFPDELDSYQTYFARFKISDSELESDIAGKLFLLEHLKKLKRSSKATLVESKNFADDIYRQLSLKYPDAKITKLLKDNIETIKNGLSEKLVSDNPTGPAVVGWNLVKKDEKSITYSNSGCTIDFQEIETSDGESYFLSRNEISADTFIRIFNAQKLWSKNNNLMPMCVREFDIYDSRSGPRTWIAKNDGSMRLRKNNEAWLEKPPTWMDHKITPNELNSQINISKLPMQYISPQLALAFAKVIGCELPNVEIMKLAITQELESVKNWNLRDTTFTKQSNYMKNLISKNQLENLSADGESYKNALGITPVENENSNTVDNCIWFENVDSKGNKFHHIIGNVAEYVTTNKGFAIMGGSSISDNIKSSQNIVDINNIDSSNGFSDVGFRVMFKKDKMNSNIQLYAAIVKLIKNS